MPVKPKHWFQWSHPPLKGISRNHIVLCSALMSREGSFTHQFTRPVRSYSHTHRSVETRSKYLLQCILRSIWKIQPIKWTKIIHQFPIWMLVNSNYRLLCAFAMFVKLVFIEWYMSKCSLPVVYTGVFVVASTICGSKHWYHNHST